MAVVSRTARSWAGIGACIMALTVQAAPREILLDQPKVQRPLDTLERLATDMALSEGAVDVPDPMVYRTANHEIIETLQVENGKCYVLSGAFETSYPLEITYSFGRTPDQLPIVIGPGTGRVVIENRSGLARFCVDRPGAVRVSVRMLDDNPSKQASHEWVLVFASRPETESQRTARHRLVAAQKSRSVQPEPREASAR